MKNTKIIAILVGMVLSYNINALAMAQLKPRIEGAPPTTIDGRPLLPDLIVSLQLSTRGAKISGMRTISYTVKNIGKAGVKYKDINLQGYLYSDDVVVPSNMTPACGTSVARTKNDNTLLQPNATVSGSFNCTDNNLFNRYRYYYLFVDVNNTIPELDDSNNFDNVSVPG
jgi:CARDB